MSLHSHNDKLLIVDDEPANIWPLIKNLETEYEIMFATSGEKALEIALSSSPPDLVLLDITMPEMDGYTVCSRLKEDPRGADIPVIFVTASLDTLSETKGFELGAVDYIKKPFDFTVVKARVRSVLNLKKEMARRLLLKSHLIEFNQQLHHNIRQRSRELEDIRQTLDHYENKYSDLFPTDVDEGPRPTILLVDDTPQNLHILSAGLQPHFEVHCAANGEKALQLAHADNPPALILLDIMMPDMDGYEVCSRLKGDPDTRDIPVIFVSAMDQPYDETRGLALGAVDYIAKPYDLPVLEARISSVLRLQKNMTQRVNLTSQLAHLNSSLEQKVREKSAVLQLTRQALQDSENKFQAIFTNAVEGIFQSTVDGKLLEANPAMAQILGFDSCEELLGQIHNTRQLYRAPHVREEFVELLQTHGFVHGFEHQFVKKDGNFTWVSLSAKVIENSPGQQHFEGFLTDISSRKQAQQALEELNRQLENRVQSRTEALEQSLQQMQLIQHQLVESQKMASLGNLLVGMSHEINTPLGNALTAISCLQHQLTEFETERQNGGISRKKFDQLLQTGHQTCELTDSNLKRIVGLVSSFKEMSVDSTSDTLVDFELHQQLQLVHNGYAAKFEQRGIEFRVSGDSPIMLHNHPGIFSSLFKHLIENSLQHGFVEGNRGTIAIKMTLDGQQVNISYQDDGIGIDQTIQQQIFEPFFTTARADQCAGLGLHIVYNLICARLKGTINCRSLARGVGFDICF